MAESIGHGASTAEVTALLERLAVEAPDLLRAASEVDLSLLERAARLTPLERVEAASRHLADLRRFRPR